MFVGMANEDKEAKINSDEKGNVVVHEQPFCGFISDVEEDDDDNRSNNEDTTVTTDDDDANDLIDDSHISSQSRDAPALNYDGNVSSHPEFSRWLDQGMTRVRANIKRF